MFFSKYWYNETDKAISITDTKESLRQNTLDPHIPTACPYTKLIVIDYIK